MRSVHKAIIFLSAAWVAITTTALAQDTGAIASGNWNDPTIWTGGAAPSTPNAVYIGSTYPTGAASVATVTLTAAESAGFVTLGDGSGTSGTLDLAGNSLTISGGLTLGSFGSLGTLNEGGGSFVANNAYVENANSLSFGANDGVAYVNLSGGSSATTAASANITGDVDILSSSKLTLGADIQLPGGYVNVQDGSTLDMAGHDVTARNFYLGLMGSSTVTLENRGTITADFFWLGNGQSFTFNAGDSASLLYLAGGAHASTTATGNVTTNVDINSGSTLTLGADLNVSGPVDVNGGSTLNAQGHALSAFVLDVGTSGTASATVSNLGQVTVNELNIGNSTVGSNLTLHGGDVVNSQITLTGGSLLSVVQMNGIGLTLNGTLAADLTIDPSSMDLIFTSLVPMSWDFRWKDPSGGANWISTIDGMIGSGQITIEGTNNYAVYDQGGYTYVGIASSAVPEPSSLLLACLAATGVGIGLARRRRRAGRSRWASRESAT